MRSTRLTAAAVAALAIGGLAACGDDESSAMPDAACDAFAELSAAFVGDPTGAGVAAQALVDHAPDDVAAAAKRVKSAFDAAAESPDALGSPAFNAALSTIGDAAFDGCDTTATVDVDGVDFAYEDLPAEVSAGRVALNRRA